MYTITTLLPHSSSAMYIGEQGKLPIITPGKLTPDLLFNFKNGAYSYFLFQEVKPEKETAKVAGGLQDGCVQMWYCLNCMAIDTMRFTAFIKLICKNWLDPGWEQEVKLPILGSSQGLKPIDDWIMLVKSTNTLLLGHACTLSTNDLHNHIQSHIHPDMMTTCTTAELYLVTDYKKYKCALKVIDNTHICADELLKATIQQMMFTSLISKCSHNSHSTATSSTAVSTTATDMMLCLSDRCPPLTSVEHALLTEHGGCFHCCQFYCNHIAPACTNSFPDKASYKPLTEANMLSTKNWNNKKNQVAPTAAVIPINPVVPVAVVMPSVVSGNGTDSEYINTPFFVPHFYFDCDAGSTTASTKVTAQALIDDGPDSVLINPEYANCLGQTQCKLPKLKEMLMVVGKGHKEVFSFDEWVLLTIISSNQAWTSHACKVILAPNLCVPILLGNPFLAMNGIVMDHALHTCIDKKSGYNLLNPPSIK